MKFIDKFPGEVVRALSWKQPYAQLMLHGKIETRVWDSKYFGWVLICASKAPYSYQQFSNISCNWSGHALAKLIEAHKLNVIHLPTDSLYNVVVKDNLISGQAIAIGKLVKSEPFLYSHQQKAYVGYQPKLYSHFYEDVQAIQPFEWHGKLGWTTLSEELKSKIILL